MGKLKTFPDYEPPKREQKPKSHSHKKSAQAQKYALVPQWRRPRGGKHGQKV